MSETTRSGKLGEWQRLKSALQPFRGRAPKTPPPPAEATEPTELMHEPAEAVD